MDTPIEIFLSLIAFTFAMGVIGLWKKIPIMLFIAGAVITFWAIMTDNIVINSQIDFISFIPQNVTIQDAQNVTDYAYNVESITMQIALNNVNKKVAEFASSSSVMVGEDIRCISYLIAKQGTPTGTVTFGIMNSSGTMVTPFGSFLIQSLPTAPNNPLHYYTLCRTTDYTIQINDYIGVEFTNGTATNFLALREDLTNPFDGTNSYRAVFTTLTWTNATSNDVTARFYSTPLVNVDLEFESDTDQYTYENNLFPFTEYPKILFGIIGAIIMLAGAMIWKYEEN